jgi:hypothetical protein
VTSLLIASEDKAVKSRCIFIMPVFQYVSCLREWTESSFFVLNEEGYWFIDLKGKLSTR